MFTIFPKYIVSPGERAYFHLHEGHNSFQRVGRKNPKCGTADININLALRT